MARRTITQVPIRFRPHTGPLQFLGDWPGVFLRGDECGEYCEAIVLVCRAVRQQIRSGNWSEDDGVELAQALASLQELSRLLKSSRLPPAELAAVAAQRGLGG